MARQIVKLAVPDKEAAAMLSLSLGEFEGLVKVGSLPGPDMIGPYPRWSVAKLQAVINGENVIEDNFEI